MGETMDYRLTPTQVIEPQYESGSIEVGPRQAFTKAGLAEATSLFFQEGDEGVLLAGGTDYAADGRRDKNGRRIHTRGTVTIPSHFYDVLGLNVDDVQANGPPIVVYAGDGVLAFERIDAIDVTFDWGEVPG